MWHAVALVREKFIPADLETSYLHLRTDSVLRRLGFAAKTRIYFYDEEGNVAGGISILFSSPGRYALLFCQEWLQPFPTSIPAERNKHWMIEKRGYRTVIYCNGVQVLDESVSSALCDDKYTETWAATWGRGASRIKFRLDTASDFYYIG